MKPVLDRNVTVSLMSMAALAVVVALLTWSSGPGNWLVAVLLAAAAGSCFVQERYGRRGDGWFPVPAWTVVLANAVLVLAALYRSSAFDGVLLAGAGILVTALAFHRLNGTSTRAFVRHAIVVNLLVSISLVLTLPEVNGASVLFRYAKFPTMVSLFGGSARNIPEIDSRSRVLMRGSRGTLAEIELRADRRLAPGDSMYLRLAPHRVSEFDVHLVDLLSFVGYDGKRVARLEGDGLAALVAESRREPLPIQVLADAVRVPPGPDENAPVWIEIPVALDRETLASTPARRRNVVSALLYWQFGFMAFMMLSPWRRDNETG